MQKTLRSLVLGPGRTDSPGAGSPHLQVLGRGSSCLPAPAEACASGEHNQRWAPCKSSMFSSSFSVSHQLPSSIINRPSSFVGSIWRNAKSSENEPRTRCITSIYLFDFFIKSIWLTGTQLLQSGKCKYLCDKHSQIKWTPVVSS